MAAIARYFFIYGYGTSTSFYDKALKAILRIVHNDLGVLLFWEPELPSCRDTNMEAHNHDDYLFQLYIVVYK